MTTIRDVATRIETELDLDWPAALESAALWAGQIAQVDRGEDRQYGPDDEVSDEDADFIVEAERRHLESEGML